MRIHKLLVEASIAEKITKKHRVNREEIERTLLEGRPIFFRTKENKYIAIGLKERYITIIFRFGKGIADIRTAYPSSEWQIRLYRRLRK